MKWILSINVHAYSPLYLAYICYTLWTIIIETSQLNVTSYTEHHVIYVLPSSGVNYILRTGLYVGWEDLRPWGDLFIKVTMANQGKWQRELDFSLPRPFAPWNFRSPELSLPVTFASSNFASRNFRTLELSLPRTFAPSNFASRNFRTLELSLPPAYTGRSEIRSRERKFQKMTSRYHLRALLSRSSWWSVAKMVWRRSSTAITLT